jgi:hypothetical protein
MKSAALALSLLLCAGGAFAKDVKVRIAWTRTFPDSSLGIFPDNLGHIAATGTENTNIIALLLNTHGREVARQIVPLPGIASATADHSGRIFLTGNDYRSSAVQCAAFSSRLEDLLWLEQKNLSNAFSPPTTSAGIGAIVPDENGNAAVWGTWHRGFFLTEFRGDDPGIQSIWDPYQSSPRRPVAGVRARSGEIYFVASSVVLHFPWITIQKFTPATRELMTYGANPPVGDSYFLPAAAACDLDGNLIVVGWVANDRHTDWRLGNYFTLKMDSQFNTLWSVRYGPLGGLTYNPITIARSVAVTMRGEIVVSGGIGTVKYSRDGNLLWEAPQHGDNMSLDRSGNVIFLSQVGRDDGLYECEILKLSSDSSLRWQTRFHDDSASDDWPAGLMTDDDGNVYFAALNGEQTTIVKLVEHGHHDD